MSETEQPPAPATDAPRDATRDDILEYLARAAERHERLIREAAGEGRSAKEQSTRAQQALDDIRAQIKALKAPTSAAGIIDGDGTLTFRLPGHPDRRIARDGRPM